MRDWEQMLSAGMPAQTFPQQATRTHTSASQMEAALQIQVFGKPRRTMFLVLAIVLVIMWACGFFLLHISSFLIHLLIIFAVISLVVHLLRGNK
jgi:hypothetical protein